MLGLVVALALSVSAADPAPCASPRAAAATIFANLRDDHLDLRRAARCAEPTPTLSHAERDRALLTLKGALDAVGARVRIDELSDNESFLDPKTFEPVAVVARELPRVRLERMDDGQWMIPASALVQADQIYDDSVAIDLQKLKKSFPAWATRKVFGLSAWQLGFLVLLVALSLVMRWVVTRLLSWRLARIIEVLKIRATRDDVARVVWPLGSLVAIGVVALGAPSLALGSRASVALMVAVRILAALSGLSFAYRIVDVVAEQMTLKAATTSTKMDDHIVPLVRRVLKIVVVCIAVVLVLQAFDVNVGSLVAGLGIGGLAVALAAKDTIGNFFGSVAIFLDRPFQIGDWVQTPDVQGTIEQVGFRSTQIRTLRDTLTSVPNAKLADAVVENFGARRYRLVRTVVGLQYDTAAERIEAFCDGVRAIVAAHPHTRKDEVQVHFHDFSDSALHVMMQFYVVVPDYSTELRIRHEVLLDIVRLARDLGVSFAFPTRTLQLAKDTDAAPATNELLEIIKAYGPGGTKAVPSGPRILPAPPTEPRPAPQEPNAPPRNP